MALLPAALPTGAQERAALGTGHGLAETIEAIERARVVTRVLYVTAHPDDESGAVLSWLARGAYADVALLSLTRGEGGQNALGPEMAPQLGLLRTEELLAACRIYGVKLYFGGAADFGFSKSPEEALKIWGEPVLANMVRVIREFRPHIIINNWGGVRTGHGQHQASGILTPQAMEAAADPARFPEQIRQGLRAWRTESLLQFARGSFPGATTSAQAAGTISIPAQQIAPLWGKSYNQIGAEGYTQHATQGVAAFGNSAFFRGPRSVALAAGAPVTLATFSRTLTSLAEGAAPGSSPLQEEDQHLKEALAAAMKQDWDAATYRLAYVSQILAKIAFADRSDAKDTANRTRAKIDAALALVNGARLDARADRSEVTPGSNVTIRVFFQKRDTKVTWSEPTLDLPAGWQIVKREAEAGATRFEVQIPATASRDNAFRMGIEPWPEPLVRARVTGTAKAYGDYSFPVTSAVTAQRVTTTHVDTLPLMVVPEVTLTPEPRDVLLAANRERKPFEVVVRVRYHAPGPASGVVAFAAPDGWSVTAPVTLKFERPGDQLVKFSITPPARVQPGVFKLALGARMGNADMLPLASSLEPLPTLPTRLWSERAEVRVHAFPLEVPAGLRVGYVAGENDPIPSSLRQIGVQVEMLDESALAFADLKRYDAIAVGIRAYELRQDLIRANQRLLDYAAQGGTLLVQYQRDGIWNALRPAPYAALVSERTRPNEPNSPRRDLRTTDENSPVRVLLPQHRALRWPNAIGKADFDGWVQERGLYYWAEFGAPYQALLGLQDPGEKEVTGALVHAQHGKGHYVFTGLSFFRQLPAGVPGAYRLLVNLLSLSKSEGRR